jgi:hypothetical protein
MLTTLNLAISVCDTNDKHMMSILVLGHAFILGIPLNE